MCNSCGCNRITSTKGDKGDTGATGPAGPAGTDGIPGPVGPAGAAWTPYDFRLAGLSTSIAAGYDYSVTGSLPAGSNVFFSFSARVSATDSHVITVYGKVGGMADTSHFYEEKTVSGANFKTVTFSWWGPYTAGQPLDIRFESSDPAVAPKLRSIVGYWWVV